MKKACPCRPRSSGLLARWSISGRALTLAPLLFLGACPGEQASSPASPSVDYDLIARFPLAAVRLPTTRLDFGEPEVRPHLISGWSGDDRANGATWVWGLGEFSSLWFFVSDVEPRTLVLRCWPFRLAGSPQQTVGVSVNGTAIGELALANGPETYHLSIPQSAQRMGENELRFDYAYNVRKSSVDPDAPNEIRPLAVAWDFLQIQEANEVPAPYVLGDAKSRALALPFGSRVDYYLELSRDASLSLASIQSAGRSSQPALEIQVLTDDLKQPRVYSLPPTSRTKTISLEVGTAGFQYVRLSLQARSVRNGEQGGGLRITQPVVKSQGPEQTRIPQAAVQESLGGFPAANVVIFNIDTLRADHLGAYGYPRPTSPHIDSFAQDAILFANARAQASWTRPAVATILTGLDPFTHGVNRKKDALSPNAQTLAEILLGAGYDTAAIVSNGNISKDFGFDQGFQVFRYLRDDDKTLKLPPHENWYSANMLEWLQHRDSDRPFFLYAHAIQPHGPYVPPDKYRELFAPGVRNKDLGSSDMLKRLQRFQQPITSTLAADLGALYDGEIATDDAAFGEFIAHLKRLSLYDQSLIIFVSDHGEEFHEHGRWEHGSTLYSEQLNIPLIVKLPGSRASGRSVMRIVRQVDIAPTILACLDLDTPQEMEGAPFLCSTTAANDSRPVLAYLDHEGKRIESITVNALKFIHTMTYDQPRPQFELYDLSTDPAERVNLAPQRPIATEYLESLLQELRLAVTARLRPAKGQYGKNVEEQLRALGYIE